MVSNFEIKEFDQYLLERHGKIIHQIWFGTIPDKRKAKKSYKALERYRNSWTEKNPDWTRIEWNKKMCISFIREFFPEHVSLYNSYPYEIQRCDVVRYFILFRYGGIYADMDYYCNKSFTLALQEYTGDIYFTETANRLGTGQHVSNSLMYSTPRHPFWKCLFIELEKARECPIYYPRHLKVMVTTGPTLLNNAFSKYKTRYRLSYFPEKYFHPYGLTDDKLSLTNNPDVYAIHLGKGSWEKQDSKLFIFLFREWRLLCLCIIIIIISIIVGRFVNN